VEPIWAEKICEGLIWAEKISTKKVIPPAAEITFETNLAKNISPKGLMGFISFGGLYFRLGGGYQAHA